MGNTFRDIFDNVVSSFINLRTVTVFVIALIVAYLVSRLLAFGILKIASFISRAGDTAKTSENRLRFRRLETYLSIALALIRFTVFAIAVVIAWEYTHTDPNSAPAAILASGTIFIVMAGATIVPMLRDLTAGSIMIAEQWYNVGDYVTVEPFMELSGVVERMNLRSTKIRSLTGEVVWVHNQHIQGVRVTPRGTRTLAIDVFVSDLKKGEALIEEVAQTLPVAPTMLAAPLEIVATAELSDKLWQITAMSETTPGREWLLESFAREAIEDADKNNHNIITYGPIVYYADPVAEHRFRRVIRVKYPRSPIEKKR